MNLLVLEWAHVEGGNIDCRNATKTLCHHIHSWLGPCTLLTSDMIPDYQNQTGADSDCWSRALRYDSHTGLTLYVQPPPAAVSSNNHNAGVSVPKTDKERFNQTF